VRRLVLAALLFSCATPGEREKGPLVPVKGVTIEQVIGGGHARRIALLVGVDHYDDPFWPALSFAEKDAGDLAATLKSPEIGRFDEARVITASSRAQLIEAIDGLARLAPNPDDVVLVYVSSHGTLADDRKDGLVPTVVLRDTRSNALLETGVRVAELIRHFDRLPSERKALILATCHSGTGKSLLPPDVATELGRLKGPAPIESVSSASLVLSAASAGQAAREDDRLGNDVYTHFFIEALRERIDANGDGAVSATEAHEVAREKTYAFTEGRQVPTVHAAITGSDPIILAGAIERAGRPVIAGHAERLAGLALYVDGRNKGAFPGEFVVEPGEHDLALVAKDGSVIASDARDLSPNAIFAAESLLATRRWSAAVRVGALGFAAGNIGDPLLMVDVALSRRGDTFDASIDVATGHSSAPIMLGGRAVDQRLTLLSFGGGVALTQSFGPLRLSVGPHLMYLVLLRSVGPAALGESQAVGTMLPGIELGASLDAGRWIIDLRARGHYLPLVLDDEVRSLAALSITAGTGYRW